MLLSSAELQLSCGASSINKAGPSESAQNLFSREAAAAAEGKILDELNPESSEKDSGILS